jgi:hypothetical protein
MLGLALAGRRGYVVRAMTAPTPTPTETPFRTCGMCRKPWASRLDFLADPGLRLLGLQAVPHDPDGNLIVFEHDCGTTVSVLAWRLRDLLPVEDRGEENLPLLYGAEGCNGYCTKLEELSACDRACSNARDRRLTLWIAEQARRRAEACGSSKGSAG